MKRIFILIVCLSVLSGCRTVMRDSELVAEPQEVTRIPMLLPFVDRASFNEHFSYEINRFGAHYPEYLYTNFFYEDARKLFEADLRQNVMLPSDEAYGYIRCTMLDNYTKDKSTGYAISSALLGCVPNLFGWPVTCNYVEMNNEFVIYDCKGNQVRKYTIFSKANATMGIYYGYTRDGGRYASVRAFKDALEELNRRISRDSQDIRFLLDRSMQELEYEQQMAAREINSDDSNFEAGCKAMDDGDYGNAIKCFDKVIGEKPFHALAFLNKGICQYREEHYADAESNLDRSIQLAPEYTDAFFYKAMILNLRNRYAEANFVIDMALETAPDNEIYNIMQGAMLEQMGYFDAARQSYRKALEINPDHLEITDWIDALDANIAIREQEMEQARYVRQQRVAASLSNAAMIMSNSLSNLNRTSTVMAVVPEPETKSHRTVSDRREICSLCNGTGYNPAKERPPFYSYDTETYDHEPCEICGDRSSHYHKKCPKCNGKGFLLN